MRNKITLFILLTALTAQLGLSLENLSCPSTSGTEAVSPAEAGQGSYFYYDGTLGQYTIHMKLRFNSYDHTVTGSYYYDWAGGKRSGTMGLKGTYSGDVTDGKVTLLEYSPSGQEIGRFKCLLSCWTYLGISNYYMQSIDGKGYYNYASGKYYEVDVSYHVDYN